MLSFFNSLFFTVVVIAKTREKSILIEKSSNEKFCSDMIGLVYKTINSPSHTEFDNAILSSNGKYKIFENQK